MGAASRLLGVAPDTLRRWADTGRIESFTTPGGHRRFLRSSLESLVNAPRRHRYGVERLTGSAGTISGEVHRRMRVVSVQRQLRLNCGQPKGLHLRTQWKTFSEVLRQ